MNTNEKQDNALVAATADDGWSSVPASSSSTIRGHLVKFKQGEYLSGEHALNTESSSPSAFLLTELGGKMGSRTRSSSPRRPRLIRGASRCGDLDKSKWPVDRNGEPSDVWCDSRNLYLCDPRTAEEYTFTTSSVVGRLAVSDLKRQIGTVRTAHPRAVPVVRLGVERMKTKYGSAAKPKFEVVDWRGTEPAPLSPRLAAKDDPGRRR